MNRVLLDANVLIAAFDQSHADHRRARAFVGALSEFHTCPQTQGAFLRFFTRPWTDSDGVRREPRMSTGQAMTRWRVIVALPEHRFLPDDVGYDAVSMRSLSGFKQWNDAYLMALARRHRAVLATLERKLENMDDPESPVVRRIP